MDQGFQKEESLLGISFCMQPVGFCVKCRCTNFTGCFLGHSQTAGELWVLLPGITPSQGVRTKKNRIWSKEREQDPCLPLRGRLQAQMLKLEIQIHGKSGTSNSSGHGNQVHMLLEVLVSYGCGRVLCSRL